MSFPSRSIVYLRPPIEATLTAPAKPAAIAVKNYPASNTATTESDIAPPGSPLYVVGAEPIKFKAIALNNTRAYLWSPPVDWPGGCRSYLSAFIGESGGGQSSRHGVTYDPVKVAAAVPSRELSCTFDSDGILTCEDDFGVKITMDLKRPAGPAGERAALCLSLTPAEPGASAEFRFEIAALNRGVCNF
ncbi:MAG TPA: hypothetical protein VIM71_12365 [Lacunisphaera sp.]